MVCGGEIPRERAAVIYIYIYNIVTVCLVLVGSSERVCCAEGVDETELLLVTTHAVLDPLNNVWSKRHRDRTAISDSIHAVLDPLNNVWSRRHRDRTAISDSIHVVLDPLNACAVLKA